MTKPRNHNEWFQPLVKKKCPTCGTKSNDVYAWGEYVNGKWRTVKHFCKSCFHKEVVVPLEAHSGPCGCIITLQARSGYSLPDWLTLEKETV